MLNFARTLLLPNAEHNLQANIWNAAAQPPLPKLDCQVHATLGIGAPMLSGDVQAASPSTASPDLS
jgi:hypothetical protein